MTEPTPTIPELARLAAARLWLTVARTDRARRRFDRALVADSPRRFDR
jgi:hypothetical protein